MFPGRRVFNHAPPSRPSARERSQSKPSPPPFSRPRPIARRQLCTGPTFANKLDMRTGVKSGKDPEIRLQLEFFVAKCRIDRKLARASLEKAVLEPDGAVATSQILDELAQERAVFDLYLHWPQARIASPPGSRAVDQTRDDCGIACRRRARLIQFAPPPPF